MSNERLAKDFDLPESTKADDGSPDFELSHDRDAMIAGPERHSEHRTYDYEIGTGRLVDGDKLEPVTEDPYEQVRDHSLVQPQPNVPADVDARSPEAVAEQVRRFHGLAEPESE